MSGYLSYEMTGVNEVDDIARTLEFAGNCFHHTSQWDEKIGHGDGKSNNDYIQDTLNACAEKIRTLQQQQA